MVVLMHGSGGMGTNIEMWARTFNAMGVSTFALDGFTGRGLTQTSTNQALLGRLNFILDIYRGLDVLAKHPRVDPQRIVLMGFSRGGQAALYASLKRFHQLWNKSGIEFAGLHPVLSGLRHHLRRRHRHRRPADPHLRRHAGRLQSDRAVQGLRGAAQGGRPRRAGHRVSERAAFLRQPARRPAGGRVAEIAERARLQDSRRGGRRVDRTSRPASRSATRTPAWNTARTSATIRRRRGRSSRR